MSSNQITVAHIVYRFDVGGLENGLVNIINGLKGKAIKHHIIALTEITDMSTRVVASDVGYYELHKRPGKDIAVYARLFRLLRRIKPDVVHTRNWGTLDCVPIAWLAGVRFRIHGEHGWDVNDPDGKVPKYRWFRRAVNPFVHRFVVLSLELERWLTRVVKIPNKKVVRICNGVNLQRIVPNVKTNPQSDLVFGMVSRFDEIKNPIALIDYFARVKLKYAHTDVALKLLMVGDGPLLSAAMRAADSHGLTHLIEFVGRQLDVLPYLNQMDVFLLTSRKEGISNTVLEAMAAGLPVIATNTGGNPELIVNGCTGYLVEDGDHEVWVRSMSAYVSSESLIREHGRNARKRAENEFALDGMITKYLNLYCSMGNE